jgi:hypothetical protein
MCLYVHTYKYIYIYEHICKYKYLHTRIIIYKYIKRTIAAYKNAQVDNKKILAGRTHVFRYRLGLCVCSFLKSISYIYIYTYKHILHKYHIYIYIDIYTYTNENMCPLQSHIPQGDLSTRLTIGPNKNVHGGFTLKQSTVIVPELQPDPAAWNSSWLNFSENRIKKTQTWNTGSRIWIDWNCYPKIR